MKRSVSPAAIVAAVVVVLALIGLVYRYFTTSSTRVEDSSTAFHRPSGPQGAPPGAARHP
jgi:hypothetical protein